MNTQEYSMEVRTQLATVQADPTFLEMLVQTSNIRQQAEALAVVNDEAEEIAGGLLLDIQEIDRRSDTMRLGATQSARMFQTAVNDAFKNVRVVREQARGDLTRKIQAYRRAKEAQMRQQAEARKKEIEEAGALSGSGPENEVEIMKVDAEAEPENVTRTEKGSMYEREVQKVVIEDKLKFVKACISKSDRNSHVTLEMLEPKMDVVERVMLSEKKKIPGVKVETHKQLTARKK